MERSRDNPWLHRYAVITAFCTLVLICAGGLVTSKEAGLAVPDWVLTHEYFPVPAVCYGVNPFSRRYAVVREESARETVAKKLNGVVTTASPGVTPAAMSDSSKASDPEATPMPWLTLHKAARSVSRRSTIGPRIYL